MPTTTPDTIVPEPVVIEPLPSMEDVATTTDLTIEPDILPNTAPSASDHVTYYIDKYYEKEWNGVARNHYFLGNINLAVEPLSGPNSGIYYVLTDHLGSSSLTTNSFGNMIDRTEYTPYGAIVATASTQDIGNKYKFTGKELDPETNLQYFGARYYDNRVGKFDSVDPMMLQIASDQRVQEKTGLKLHQLLSDPQSLNSYAYSRNNPIILVDPDGRWFWEAMTGKQSAADFQVELGQAAQNMYETSSVWKNAMDHPVATGVIVGVASGGIAYGAAAGLTTLSAQYFGGIGTSCIAFCSQVDKVQKILESGRGWSPGSVGDSIKSLITHFENHGDELGAKNVKQYYQMANDFITNKSYTNTWFEGAQQVFYNTETNIIGILNKDGAISSFYKVTDPGKLAHLVNLISKLTSNQ